MSTGNQKKLISLYILDILKRHSDEDHRLKQKDIIEYLKSDFELEVDRKTVLRDLEDLVKFDDNIQIGEEFKRGKGDNSNDIKSGYYYEHDLTNSELRTIIDSIIFNKFIPKHARKDLINNISELGSEYFKSKTKYIDMPEVGDVVNKELFYNIDVINQAIDEGKKISFKYLTFDLKLKAHKRKDNEGNERIYKMTPFRIIASNDRYYLLCIDDKHDNVAHYRVDRMTDVKMLNDDARSSEDVKKAIKDFSIPKHVLEYFYMLGNESGAVKFEFSEKVLDAVVDWFGHDITLRKLKNGNIEATTHASYDAMKYWAMQYIDAATVTYPKKLVDDIKKILKENKGRYGL